MQSFQFVYGKQVWSTKTNKTLEYRITMQRASEKVNANFGCNKCASPPDSTNGNLNWNITYDKENLLRDI